MTITRISDIEIQADYAHAACVIRWRMVESDDAAWQATPFQVGDVSHNPDVAAARVNAWLESQA